VFTTILAYVLRDNPHLQQRIPHSALVEFPVIGDQLKTEGLRGRWYVLVVSRVIALWCPRGRGCRAVGVEHRVERALRAAPRLPAGPGPQLRSAGRDERGGPGDQLLSGIGESGDALGILTRVGVLVASAVINVGVFLLGFRLATAKEVALREMVPGAVISAVPWQVLLVVGTFLVVQQVRHQQSLCGTFGAVLGLLAWLHL
jgi:membrane protein